jgi:polygalacturonase
MKMFLAMVIMVVSVADAQAQDYYNVLKYGAKRDSSAIATKAIQAAINAASKMGGGTVYFPAGKYLTGPIHLKSNITILIDAGAVLHFSDNFDDYLPMVPSRWEGTNVVNFSPLFYAYKAENITICGRGTIDGHGRKWWLKHFEVNDSKSPTKAAPDKWQQEFVRSNPNLPKPEQRSSLDNHFLRPPFIQPMYCKNVRIEGITIQNSPFWTVNPEYCENVTVTGVTINNPHSPNTDGINPESCRYVHIDNCHISVGDDCITIKSGKDADGRNAAAPAENYTITNCTMLAGHGGVVIGSEMSGDVKKIVISNCVFDGTDRGIRIKSARGRGGVVEEVRVDNIVMKNIKEQAFVMDLQYAKTQPAPVFRNLHFSNVTAQTKEAIFINGLEEMPVENVTFNDIQFDAETGANIKVAKNIEFHNVRINTKTSSAIKAENVKQLEIDGVKSLTPLAGTAIVSLNNTEDVFIHNCSPVVGTDVFLQLKGNNTKEVALKSNNFKYVKEAVQKEAAVVAGAVQMDEK